MSLQVNPNPKPDQNVVLWVQRNVKVHYRTNVPLRSV